MNKIKLELNGAITYCNERNLKTYINGGWVVVEEEQPTPSVEGFTKLNKTQLKQLCKEKGIDFKPRDTNEVLRAKLQTVTKKTVSEKPTNKGFNDSLIKE